LECTTKSIALICSPGSNFAGKNGHKATKQCAIDSCVCTSLQPFRLVSVFWWWLVVFPWCAGAL